MNDETREVVRQWRAKALNDWTTVEILMKSEQCPAESVCFHCQQYVEKLLKALLTQEGVEAPKTHDLRRLIQLAHPFIPELFSLVEPSDILTVHSVQTRYPDEFYEIDVIELNEVVELAKKFGEILFPALNK